MGNALANILGRLQSRTAWTEFSNQTLERHINMARFGGSYVGSSGSGFRAALRRSVKCSEEDAGDCGDDADDYDAGDYLEK